MDHYDKNYLANIDRLVAVTDSELFENVVTRVYQRKEYIFKKKSANKQPHYRIPRLAALKCTASELDARIQALNLPDDIAIYGIAIPHPGFWCEHDEPFDSKNKDVNTVRRPSSPVGSEQMCEESHREERNMHSHISWKSLGIRFMRNVNRWSDEESSSEEEDEEALYVKKIKPHSVAAGRLIIEIRAPLFVELGDNHLHLEPCDDSVAVVTLPILKAVFRFVTTSFDIAPFVK
ncbi:unnamed protein product [Dibothriocephalus latus]|uniref:Uncharacterized protein n=1 Tax=Dibothriocephalus latus TaxID=60516 RepID=A0A3P7LNC4_DIBLA|nr:unnamed protein product [Dibothriocephalus latus]